MTTLPLRVRAEVFLRSLVIQSGWNYRTMIGGGVAFAMIPVLRYLRRVREEPSDGRLDHYGAHFNAHPYLASAALGALARMEVDGEPAQKIERFRNAVRGPLGALGDRLVWAAWLPLCALLAMAAFWSGAAAWVAVTLFLLLYNAGHLLLRIWGFGLGWEAGPGLGARLREAHLPGMTHRLERMLPVVVGLVLGVAAASGAGGVAGEATLVTIETSVVAVVAGLAIGAGVGARAWRPAAAVAVAAVGIALIFAWTR